MRYGMPYKGSKNSIAAEIISVLPPAKHFYDIFGGGGAMTHAAALSGKYQYIHYNELNPLICEGFKRVISGRIPDPRQWVTRADFTRLKNEDPMIAICWSFGNNLREYLYAVERGPLKKAWHYLYQYHTDALLRDMEIAGAPLAGEKEIRSWARDHADEIKEKYVTWYKAVHYADPQFDTVVALTAAERGYKQICERLRAYLREGLKRSGLTQADVDRLTGTYMAGHYFGSCQWEFPTEEAYGFLQKFIPLDLSWESTGGQYLTAMREMQRLNALKDLEDLKPFEFTRPPDAVPRIERLKGIDLSGHSITVTCGDYRDLDFESDAVIYADPPYRGTDQYGAEFDSDAFIFWAEEQKPPVYVSEADYIDRWDIVWSAQKTELLRVGNGKTRTEILYKVVKNEGSI